MRFFTSMKKLIFCSIFFLKFRPEIYFLNKF